MTWEERFSALALMDGDGWEDEYTRLKAAWTDVYTEKFLNFAVGRGWKLEDAETWPEHLIDDAFSEAHRRQYDPQLCAQYDVIACEAECE